MALDPNAIGKHTETHVHSYDFEDVILYALGVGAERDAELDYLYEGRGPKVLPTYAVIPAWAAVTECFDLIGGDLLGVLHGGQSITLHRPFPPKGELHTVGTIAGAYDLKRMATAVFTTETRDAEGTLISETEWNIVFRNDGGFGGERPPKRSKVTVPKDASPVFEREMPLSKEQALLYRLSGDRNPLHADPAVAKKVGFDAPILHGLCTYGFVGRAILDGFCGGEASRLGRFAASFQAPVWPGETLVVRGYETDEGKTVTASTLERPEEIAVGNVTIELS